MTAQISRVIAEQLQAAWCNRSPIQPFSESEMLSTPEDAYAAQRAWAAIRAGEGERTIGRKIGLTSPGMRAQMGVAEPDYGDLWASRYFPASDGEVTIDLGQFIAPRLEGELAFLLAEDLNSTSVSDADVRQATSSVSAALEIVDSRICDWRITLVDTIADNASFGGFTHGPWDRALLDVDLALVSMQLSRNGEVVIRETGAEVMGSPVSAVSWLARKLAGFGIPLSAGDIVLSGSFGRALEIAAGDEFALEVEGSPTLTARFT
jgi:2-keto-4-pentenoate hydratase